MDDLRLYVLSNSNSVISGQWGGDNEKLCVMEPCLQLEWFHFQAGLKSETTISTSQHLTYWATGAQILWKSPNTHKMYINFGLPSTTLSFSSPVFL